MRPIRTLLILPLVAIAAQAGAAPAAARGGLPTAAGGHHVQLFATGPRALTAFAFGAGRMFVSGSDVNETRRTTGGVFVARHGRLRRLPGSPSAANGVAWRAGTLYISAGYELLAWSGWNGSSFTHRGRIYVAPSGFTSFNGLGLGADGRLYAGVTSTAEFDHTFSSRVPYLFDVLSITATGGDVRIVARGIRQPWQLAFPRGSSSPFVSDLGQDGGATNPPDFVMRVTPGQDYGFPGWNWTAPPACTGDVRPFAQFPAHTDPMGLAILAGRLYISEYGNPRLTPAKVVSMPLGGGPAKPVLTGFATRILALGAHGGWVYVAGLDGRVFRVKP